MLAARIDSSVINRIAYDESAKILSIWFRDSGCYFYADVPRQIYDGIKSAESPGRYFAAHVKGRYPCRPERKKFRPVND